MEDYKTKTMDLSKIYEAYPYMESFPFDFYRMNLTKDIDIHYQSYEVIANGDEDRSITFSYNENGNDIHIFITPEDMYFLDVKSKEIKILDSVLTMLNNGLSANDLRAKANCVIDAMDFLEKIDDSYSNIDNFDGILDSLIGINNADISIIITDKIKKLLEGENVKIYPSEKDSITSYFNFQLHYTKIFLGIVIAAKIH